MRNGPAIPVIAGFACGALLLGAFAFFVPSPDNTLTKAVITNTSNIPDVIPRSQANYLKYGLGIDFYGERPIIQVVAKTDDNRTVFPYGTTIPLNVSLVNNSNAILSISQSLLKPYAGLARTCSNEEYFDFVILNGTFPEIASYDDLLHVRPSAIYVNDPPFQPHSCLLAGVGKVYGAKIMPFNENGNGDSKYTIYFATKHGGLDSRDVHTFPTEDYIRRMYIKHTDQTSGREYATAKPLPVGKYTAVGFTMSGEISSPLVFEIR